VVFRTRRLQPGHTVLQFSARLLDSLIAFYMGAIASCCFDSTDKPACPVSAECAVVITANQAAAAAARRLLPCPASAGPGAHWLEQCVG
jgi:hypothetical protein